MRDARERSRIRELRSGDAFLPIAVVVPSHLLGAWLAPRIFAETGHLGIGFHLLPELAWRVAEGRALAEGLGADARERGPRARCWPRRRARRSRPRPRAT